MPAWINERATESIDTASSRELRPGPHKKQENTPSAYSQNEMAKYPPIPICFLESERNEQKAP